MSVSKKYYWLKQPTTFFQDPKIKKLRRIAGGDTYTIIYQKLMLLSISNGGLLTYSNIEPTFAEELSLILDEEEDNIKVTLSYMESQGLIEECGQDTYLLTNVPTLIGSETDSAERVRKFRARKYQKLGISEEKALHCNGLVTSSNTELEKEKEIEIKNKPKLSDYEKFLEELKSKVILKTKVTKTIEGKQLFKEIQDKDKLIQDYVKYQLEKREYAIKITAYMKDYSFYQSNSNTSKKKKQVLI